MEKPIVLNFTTGGEMLVYTEAELAEAMDRLTRSGSGPNSEFGQTEHWFEGHGVCGSCGFQGYYSDSSF